MSDPSKIPIIIHFTLDTEWDARGHHVYLQAPDDFEDMSPEGRQKFLDEELETWRDEQVQGSATVYRGHEAAERATKNQWGSQYSPDQLEQRW